MDSNRFSLLGILFIVVVILAFIVAARFLNPFDEALPRILFSALFGGIGGGVGAVSAKKLGLTKP